MASLPPLPRMGVSLAAPAGFEQFTWLGRGPQESYIDRKAGVPVGLYQGTVDEQYVPYIMPQENGNKTDVRWAALSKRQSRACWPSGEPLLEVSVSHYTADDLYTGVSHQRTGPPGRDVSSTWTWSQCGLGGNSCGPRTLDKYLVVPGEYHFSILFRPFAAGKSLTRLGRKWVEKI